MKTLYQKLSILLNNITIESGYLAREKITYNDEGLVSFQSYRMEAFYGLLLAAGCVACIIYKKKNN